MNKNIPFLCVAGFAAVSAALSFPVLAADVSITPPAGGGFVVKDSGGAERFRVQATGEVRVPGLSGAAANTTITCFDGATGQLGPCAAGTGTGAAGPAGPAGPVGASGPAGPGGPAGPQGVSGVSGSAGSQGPAGTPGAPGANGRTILNGSGAPAAAVGVDGDFYLNSANNELFGPKGAVSAGQWPTPGASLVGPAGAVGAAGSAGPAGPAGAIGPAGPTGGQGTQGLQGIQGLVGPAGATGAAGAIGPAGPAGGGAILVDGNGVTLGKVVSATRSSVSIVTSAGYLTIVNWNGSFPAGQIYYTSFSGGVCGGSAFLNSGNSSTQYSYGKNLVWSASLNTLMTVGPALADGTAATVAGSGIQGIDNPGCSASSSTNHMWALTAVSSSAAGLPGTIGVPLSIQ